MPKKKKAGGKKKKKSSSSGTPSTAAKAEEPFEPLTVLETAEQWVNLTLELTNWSFSRQTLRLRTSTPLFVVREHIQRQHGRITNLRLFQDRATDDKELKGEFVTLEEVGIRGAPDDAEEPVEQVIKYDFTPKDYDNPLLL